MMCARLLHEPHERRSRAAFGAWLERGFDAHAARLRAHARLGAAASAR